MPDPESSPSRLALAAKIAKYAYNPSSSSSTSSARTDQRDVQATPSPPFGINAASRVLGSDRSAGNAKQINVDNIRRSPRRTKQAQSARKRDLERSPWDQASGAEGDVDDEYWPPGDAGSISTPSDDVRLSDTPTKRPHTALARADSASPAASPSSKAKKGKIPRGYAPPETYAHLKNTPDHLRIGLRGKQSAATGTHFAHPTNKFWRALDQSGLTSRLYAPAECHLLPEQEQYGLTNLCGRPTAEQAELSPLEMRLNVHPFTLKVTHHRPRVVCFVGKKIWDIYASVCGKTANAAPLTAANRREADVGQGDDGSYVPIKAEAEQSSEQTQEGLLQMPEPPCVPVKAELDIVSSDAKPIAVEPEGAFELEEVDVKPSLGDLGQTAASAAQARDHVSSPSKAKGKAPMDWHAPRPFRLPLPPRPDTSDAVHDGRAGQEYTYFWATPSTSGLERTPMTELVSIFASLKAFSDRLEAGYTPPAGSFRDIDLDGLARTSESIRTAALAQGKTVLDSVHALTYE